MLRPVATTARPSEQRYHAPPPPAQKPLDATGLIALRRGRHRVGCSGLREEAPLLGLDSVMARREEGSTLVLAVGERIVRVGADMHARHLHQTAWRVRARVEVADRARGDLQDGEPVAHKPGRGTGQRRAT